MASSDTPAEQQKQKFKEKLQDKFNERTKERQVKFLNTTIIKLESFKKSIEAGEVLIDSATLQCEHNAPTSEEAGGHNIYINIDYQANELNND